MSDIFILLFIMSFWSSMVSAVAWYKKRSPDPLPAGGMLVDLPQSKNTGD